MSKIDFSLFWFIGNKKRDSTVDALAQKFPVNHQNARRVARENAFVQSEKSRVYRRQRAVSGRNRRSRFKSDCRVERVNDIKPDFRQIKPQEIYFNDFGFRAAFYFGVFDAVLQGFEILGERFFSVKDAKDAKCQEKKLAFT